MLLCGCMPMQLCMSTWLWAGVLNRARVPSFGRPLFWQGVLPLFGCLCPLSHSSVRTSLCLTVWHGVRQSACLCVPACCLLSVYCVSHWVSHQTAVGSAKVTKSSVGKIVSRQTHANLLPIRIATHTHALTCPYSHKQRHNNNRKYL